MRRQLALLLLLSLAHNGISKTPPPSTTTRAPTTSTSMPTSMQPTTATSKPEQLSCYTNTTSKTVCRNSTEQCALVIKFDSQITNKTLVSALMMHPMTEELKCLAREDYKSEERISENAYLKYYKSGKKSVYYEFCSLANCNLQRLAMIQEMRKLYENKETTRADDEIHVSVLVLVFSLMLSVVVTSLICMAVYSLIIKKRQKKGQPAESKEGKEKGAGRSPTENTEETSKTPKKSAEQTMKNGEKTGKTPKATSKPAKTPVKTGKSPKPSSAAKTPVKAGKSPKTAKPSAAAKTSAKTPAKAKK